MFLLVTWPYVGDDSMDDSGGLGMKFMTQVCRGKTRTFGTPCGTVRVNPWEFLN